jgi:CelD/BcsL family acetyltransferase involved in cellulose biosynthesis
MRALPFDTGVKSNGTVARPAVPQSAPAASAHLTLFTSLEEAGPFWTAFEKEAALHVFQTFAWAKIFQETVGKAENLRPLIVAVETSRGAPLMLFPLALEEKGALTKLIWLGGDTADYQAPLLAPGWRASLAPQTFTALWKEIRAALPAHDLIDLGKQPADIQGTDNPFMELGPDLHPAGTHMTRLAEDWESYYKSKRSSSTRKRDRNRRNNLKRLGELSYEVPQSAGEIDTSLSALFEQKNAFFADCGIASFLKKPGYTDFYRQMAKAHAGSGLIDVSHLRVGEEIAATNWGARFRGHYYYVLGGFTTSPSGKYSPGSLFLLDLLEKETKAGNIHTFDFSIGDEAYKDDWCELHFPLYDYKAASSLKGLLALVPLRLAARLKRFLKQSPRAWALAQSVRKRLGQLRRG